MSGEGRLRAAVVTVSDRVSRGVRDDASGRAVAAILEGAGFDVVRREVVPDERDRVAALLASLADDDAVPLVVTTGGTGLGPRDVTPEATQDAIDREAPGLAEAMRASGRANPFAALSRGVAGSRRGTLILNLPGSERGAVESLGAVLPALPHALDLLAGDTTHRPEGAVSNEEEHRHAGHERGDSAGSIEDDLAARRASGQAVVMATAVKVEGNPPCRVGQKILLGPSGALAGTLGCAEFDQSAVADAPRFLRSGAPGTRTYTHELGSVEVYLEPFARRPLLVVVSATPVAACLLRWGKDVGFDPVLVEPRSERVTPELRASAPVRPSLEGLGIDADTAAVHTDHDAPGVAESVAELLRSRARFVAVMGSRRHVGPHVERLRGLGFGDEELARIRTPAGIDIGARTAEEIALSILAGVVADRHDAGGGWLDRPRPPDGAP